MGTDAVKSYDELPTIFHGKSSGHAVHQMATRQPPIELLPCGISRKRASDIKVASFKPALGILLAQI